MAIDMTRSVSDVSLRHVSLGGELTSTLKVVVTAPSLSLNRVSKALSPSFFSVNHHLDLDAEPLRRRGARL